MLTSDMMRLLRRKSITRSSNELIMTDSGLTKVISGAQFVGRPRLARITRDLTSSRGLSTKRHRWMLESQCACSETRSDVTAIRALFVSWPRDLSRSTRTLCSDSVV